MSENKTNLWMIVGVVIVVAVLSSVATISLTGNSIKVTSAKAGTDVYTKVEVDTKLNSLAICPNLDFNCDGKITNDDGAIVNGYWQSGKKITMSVVISAKCPQLMDFLAPYWQQNKNNGLVPIEDATLASSQIVICQNLGVKYI